MDSETQFTLLTTPQEIEASFEVMRELRPHLTARADYVERVGRQLAQGYMLLGARKAGEILGLAGYRHLENLLYGRFTYVDDLVVRSDVQRGRIGKRLLEEVRRQAEAEGDAALVLDTGLANALAQRFYFRQGLLTRGIYFGQRLS